MDAKTKPIRTDGPLQGDQSDDARADPDRHCPDCGSDRLVRDSRGETYCGSCGLVLEEQAIDRGPEWRAYTAAEEEDRSRAGAPMTLTLHDKGLSTMMGWPGRDAAGKPIRGKARSQLHRMQRWNRRMRTSGSSERGLARALGDMARIASNLSLPKPVQETSAAIYRQASKKDLIRGRSIEDVVGASLYAACRSHSIPRTLEEVAEAAGVKKKAMARSYRTLSRELGLALEPTSPRSYVPRFASALELGDEARSAADHLLEKAAEAGVADGAAPSGLAAAAIYAAARKADEHRTQSEVAKVAGVSEVTIRNRLKDFENAGLV